MMKEEQIRVDKWIWAVRLYKTRSQAKTDCDSGKISVNGNVVKASKLIKVGDMVEAKRPRYTRKYEVTKLIPKRVSAPLAAECFKDHSPEIPKKDDMVILPVAVRERGSGRPTKKDRRDMQKFTHFWE